VLARKNYIFSIREKTKDGFFCQCFQVILVGYPFYREALAPDRGDTNAGISSF
jgi:hypothetical protein